MIKIIALTSCALLISGCVPLLIGVGAVTGYALSTDSAIGNVKTDYRSLWDICQDKVHQFNAEIIKADESQGLMKIRISEYDVTIKIKNLDSDLQRLKVSARKLLLPKPQFAQKIFLDIIEAL